MIRKYVNTFSRVSWYPETRHVYRCGSPLVREETMTWVKLSIYGLFRKKDHSQSPH